MLTITPALKKFAVETLSVAADANDDAVRKAVSEALAAGKVDLAKLAELTTVKASEAELKVKGMIAEAIGPVMEAIKALGGPAKPDGTTAAGTPTETKATNLTNHATAGTPAGGTGTPPAPASDPAKAYAAAGMAGANGAGTGDANEMRIRVKSVAEQFSDSRSAATWDKSSSDYMQKGFGGESVTKHVEGLPYSVDMPSDRQKAIAGAWLKHMAARSLRAEGKPVPQHWLKQIDRDLVQYAARECKFVGAVNAGGFSYEFDGEELSKAHNGELFVKAVLDDSTSGGLEAVPIEFDAAVILTPLLNGELFPLVNVTNVTRRRIEATSIGNPTMGWGTAEGASIGLFDTDSFISAFDNSIYPLVGAMEIGLDFLADSPLAVGRVIVERYGQRFLQEMDNAIAEGNGTNRPEGVFTKAGTTGPSNSGSAATVGLYEQLMFGVAKEYRQEAGLRPESSRAVFIANDTSYRRARAIPVDSSADARRIFGMDHMNYQLFGYRYAINAGLANAQIGFACMNRYRLYRRQGLEARVVREDWTLARQNQEGLVLRARFGGALEQAAAASICTTGET